MLRQTFRQVGCQPPTGVDANAVDIMIVYLAEAGTAFRLVTLTMSVLTNMPHTSQV
jgi:hypothetical protein